MKRKKLVLQKNEQQHEQEDIETIKEINAALTRIDQNYSVFTPDLQSLERRVLSEQRRQRKKLIRELLAFTLLALLIISGLLTALLQVPVAFFVIQGIATISLPVYVYLQYRKRVVST